MIDRDSLLHGPVMAALGRPAEYEPPGGGARVPCTVRFRHGDRGVPLLDAGIATPARMAVARAAELSPEARGGFLIVGGTVYPVVSAMQPDAHRLLWHFELGDPA